MKYITSILVFLLVIISACDPPIDVSRPGDKLSGYVTHIDSILYMNGGYYSISIYNADSTNPFNRVPVRTDSLNLTRRDWLFETPFTMEGVPSGRYYIAATWSTYPKIPNEIPLVLGTHGCDTNSNCSNHKMVVYPNHEGKFRNLFAWTDPAKRLY
ncbi:MAG: hypothetical protein UZ05_CHB002000625 [Chlorobi bacterium OLB5]|nr:MAG: hypothetical protein UZ05_CHB002000625 [Chlorobi bacterium OLB5]